MPAHGDLGDDNGTAAGLAGINYIGLDNVSVDFVSAAPVPEPGTWGLMAAGLVPLLLALRRRRAA